MGLTDRYLVSGKPISDYYPAPGAYGHDPNEPDTRVWEYRVDCGDSYVNIGPLPLQRGVRVWCSKHP